MNQEKKREEERKIDKKIAESAVLSSSYFSNLGNISLEYLRGGGYGDVFEIFSNGQTTGKVIKVPRFFRIEQANKAFKKEIDALYKVKGSNYIVEILDKGTTEYEDVKCRYYISEKLNEITETGEENSLSYSRVFTDPLSNDNSFSEAEACVFILQVTQALCDANESYSDSGKSIDSSHRDLKIDNIMYKSDKDGRRIYKVIDFGGFKVKDEDSMSTDTGIGTLEFMAPERVMKIKSKNISKGDTYSLGCVIYQLLSRNNLRISDYVKKDFEEGFLEEYDDLSKDDQRRAVLKHLYNNFDFEEYYTGEGKYYLDDSIHEHLPDKKFFGPHILNGSKELRFLIRRMMELNYLDRLSILQVQAEILNLIDGSNNCGDLKAEDFAGVISGYDLYEENKYEAKRKNNINENDHSDTEPLGQRIVIGRKKFEPPKSEKTSSDNRCKNNMHSALSIIVFLMLLVLGGLNLVLMSLPIIDYDLYSKAIGIITGNPPYYTADGGWIACYIIPFIVALLTFLLVVPVGYRGFISLNYRRCKLRRLRLSLMIIAILCALGIGIFDVLSTPSPLNHQWDCYYNLPFLLRRMIESLIIIGLNIFGITSIIKYEPYMKSYRIKSKSKVYYSIQSILFLLVALFSIAFSVSPLFKYATNALTEEFSTQYSEYSNVEDIYTDTGDISQEKKIEEAKFYSLLAGIWSYLCLLSIFPVYVLYEFYKSEQHPFVTRIDFIKQSEEQEKKKGKQPGFTELWEFINHKTITELSINGFGLTDEQARKVFLTEMEHLTSVSLDDNQIEGFDSPFPKSYSVTNFSCRSNWLYSLSGLRTLSKLQSIDCANNRLESLDFLQRANKEIRDNLKELDISNNNFNQDELDYTLDKFTNLEKLNMGYLCNINSIEFLQEHSKLNSLSIVGAYLSDISPLKGKRLTTLTLASCHLDDISALSEGVLHTFEDVSLDLRGNNLTDISSLSAFRHFSKLLLSYNPIDDFSPLRFLEECDEKCDMIEISYSNNTDFIKQLDMLKGFSHIIIREIDDTDFGAIDRKLKSLGVQYELYKSSDCPYPFDEEYEYNTPNEINDSFKF